MSNPILEKFNMLTNKQKLIFVLVIWVCIVLWVSFSTKNKVTQENNKTEVTQSGSTTWTWSVAEGWKINKEQKTFELEVEFKWKFTKTYMKTDDNGWTNILIGWLKTWADAENNILALMSLNPAKQLAVFNIIDPRTRFSSWTVNPQELKMSSSLMKAVSDELEIDIQYYTTIQPNSIGYLSAFFQDENSSLFNKWIKFAENIYVVNNEVGFDLLTRNKGTQENMQMVYSFLSETNFDIRWKWLLMFQLLFWEAGNGNNLTDEEAFAIGWYVTRDNWMPKPPVKSSNLFITDRSAGNYVFEKGIDETTGKEYIYGKLSKKAIEQIQNSLMQ